MYVYIYIYIYVYYARGRGLLRKVTTSAFPSCARRQWSRRPKTWVKN